MLFKKIINSFFIFFIYFIILIFCLELTSRAIVYFYYGNLKETSEILNSNRALNEYTKQIEKEGQCSYNDILFQHPYLGWILWDNPKCQNNRFNNYGFIGPDLPDEYDKEYFSILITGGSVSQQFGPGRDCSQQKNVFCRNFLGEQLINFRSIDGKKIRIFNAGNGAYKHPHQEIISTLHGHLFDLVISLEGFNEHYAFYDTNMNKISRPGNDFIITAGRFYKKNFINDLIVNFSLGIKRIISKYNYLEKSYFVTIFYHGLKKVVQKIITEGDKIAFYNRLFSINTETSLITMIKVKNT